MNKVALVTGSSRGIGLKIIYELAKNNYDVIINYNNDYVSALNLEKEIKESFNVKTMVIKCDISNEEEVKEMVDKAISYFGKVDILINNAGISIDTLYEDKTTENFKKIIDTNLIGPFIISRLLGDIMYKNGYGKIINISSNCALEAYYEESLDYDASKAGLISLTHNLAKHYAPIVNVNALALGWVDTDMNKNLSSEFKKQELDKVYLHRFATAEEIAKIVCFLCSDDANYINNEVIRVDGGTNHA